MEDRTHRIMADADIARIADPYHAWRGDGGEYKDMPGFCKAASVEEVRTHGHILTPGRYVGAAPIEEDSEPFEEKMAKLKSTLRAQFENSNALQGEILHLLGKDSNV